MIRGLGDPEATRCSVSLAVFGEEEDFQFLNDEVGLVDPGAVFLVRVRLDRSFNKDLVAFLPDLDIGHALAHLLWEDCDRVPVCFGFPVSLVVLDLAI